MPDFLDVQLLHNKKQLLQFSISSISHNKNQKLTVNTTHNREYNKARHFTLHTLEKEIKLLDNKIGQNEENNYTQSFLNQSVFAAVGVFMSHWSK